MERETRRTSTMMVILATLLLLGPLPGSAQDPSSAKGADSDRSAKVDRWLEEPSVEHFRSLMIHLEGSNPDEATLAAIEERLRESWLEEKRMAPVSWTDQLVRGDRHDLFGLVRGLRIRDVDQFEGLMASEAFANVMDESPITRLDIAEARIGDDGAEALAGLPHVSRVEWLDLSEADIGDSGARALAESEHFERLDTLLLRGNRIGTRGAKALVQRTKSHGPLELDLSYNPLGDEAARALAKMTSLQRVSTLTIRGTEIGSAGYEALEESPNISCAKLEGPSELCESDEKTILGSIGHTQPEEESSVADTLGDGKGTAMKPATKPLPKTPYEKASERARKEREARERAEEKRKRENPCEAKIKFTGAEIVTGEERMELSRINYEMRNRSGPRLATCWRDRKKSCLSEPVDLSVFVTIKSNGRVGDVEVIDGNLSIERQYCVEGRLANGRYPPPKDGSVGFKASFRMKTFRREE